jgi:hypothetical protein
VAVVDAPGRGVSHHRVHRAAARPRVLRTLVSDNLDIGRPDQVELIFTGKNEHRGRPRKQPPTFKTKVVTRGVEVTINAFYKHSRIKQYLKDGHALRVETVVNDPYDLGCQRRLHNLPELQTKARVGFQNPAGASELRSHAAGSYSLISPPSNGRRRILVRRGATRERFGRGGCK